MKQTNSVKRSRITPGTFTKKPLCKVSLDVDSERMSPESRLNKVSPLIYVKTFSSTTSSEYVAVCIVYTYFSVFILKFCYCFIPNGKKVTVLGCIINYVIDSQTPEVFSNLIWSKKVITKVTIKNKIWFLLFSIKNGHFNPICYFYSWQWPMVFLNKSNEDTVCLTRT